MRTDMAEDTHFERDPGASQGPLACVESSKTGPSPLLRNAAAIPRNGSHDFSPGHEHG